MREADTADATADVEYEEDDEGEDAYEADDGGEYDSRGLHRKDGEEVEVTLDELQNGYSRGRHALSVRWS